MSDISLKYRKQFLKRQLEYKDRSRALFNKIADQFAAMADDPAARMAKGFKFPQVLNKKIENITKDFQAQALTMTEREITWAWQHSNAKNDEIVNQYLQRITGLKASQGAAYTAPNTAALQAFISRDNGTGTLSDRVWKIADQMRAEMEIHLGIGIANGDSSQRISQRIRQYLNNPDALFRRVKDKTTGKLVPSKNMKAYHPGQGVYRSAYKNAWRVTRTETNQAYLLSDSIRWSQMDMVTGIKITLSAQHRIIDICDDCQGSYPKNFIFTGWHPQCMCHATPILSNEDEFMNYLDTGVAEYTGQITQPPEGFISHMQDNIDTYTNYKRLPYFMQNNPAFVTSALQAAKIPTPEIPTSQAAKIAEKAIKKAEQTKQGTLTFDQDEQAETAVPKAQKTPPRPEPRDMTDLDFENNNIFDKILKSDQSLSEDDILKTIIHENHMDGLPTLLNKAEFDKTEGLLAYRGVTGGYGYGEQFLKGNYFSGRGIYGNGTYAAVYRNTDDAMRIATNYAGGQGEIISLKLPQNAKVIQLEELEKEMESFIKEINAKRLKAFETQDKELWNKTNKLWTIMQDPGRFAALKGYDAFICNYGEYIVVLNRSKTIALDTLIITK